ncbi:peptidase S8/S53 domain-containing protein [Lactarius hatsudake]|nr:peptidase S8/S53 domain-containing protein [Lactarius hatsudake]
MRYYLFSLFSVLIDLITGSLGNLMTPIAPGWGDIHTKHAWKAVPMKWESLGPPPVGAMIDLCIALKSHNEGRLDRCTLQCQQSRPSKVRPIYLPPRMHVSTLVAPHPDTLELVHSWLEYQGVHTLSVTQSGNWLKLIGLPVSQADDLLGASFRLYRHTDTNDTILRTLSYALPEVLHAHVQTITPTTYFGPPRTPRGAPRTHPGSVTAAWAKPEYKEPARVSFIRNSGSDGDDDDDDDVAPSYMRWLYNTMGYVPKAADRNVLGIVGFKGDYPSPQDLELFMEEFRTDGEDATFTVLQINGGGYDPAGEPGIESSLSIQYASAMAYPTPNTFYSVGGNWDDALMSWLHYMVDQEVVPQTLTTTYGIDEVKVPPDYAASACLLFAQLGLRGVSVLYSSGDDGVGEGDCLVGDSSGGRHVQFIPVFPASCPWLTVVGGTTSHAPEIAASISGGGFSNVFQRPDYQNIAVPFYLHTLGDRYNWLLQGRGYPDIAAQAFHCGIVVNGEFMHIDGTSCATPTVAGIIALLNDYRLYKGKPVLGFLNYWLYGSGLTGLNDITSGSNPGCNTDGFPAIVGWDPVTGLGSLNFDKLEEILDDQVD